MEGYASGCLICRGTVAGSSSKNGETVTRFLEFTKELSLSGLDQNDEYNPPTPSEVCDLCRIKMQEVLDEKISVVKVESCVRKLQLELTAELVKLDTLLGRLQIKMRTILDRGAVQNDTVETLVTRGMETLRTRKLKVRSRVSLDNVENTGLAPALRPSSVASDSLSFEIDGDRGSEDEYNDEQTEHVKNATVPEDHLLVLLNKKNVTTSNEQSPPENTKKPVKRKRKKGWAKPAKKGNAPKRQKKRLQTPKIEQDSDFSDDGMISIDDSSDLSEPSPPPNKSKKTKKPFHHCEKCEMSFSSLGTYTRHLKRPIHLNAGIEKPPPPTEFPCPICLKVFATKANMTNHHSPVHKQREKKYFNCNQCDQRFSVEGALKVRLIKVHHAKPEPYSTFETCDICHGIFSSRGTRDQHRLTHLSMEKRERRTCELCGRTMLKAGFHRHHLFCSALEKNQIKSVICDVCGNAFKNSLALGFHQRRVHQKLTEDLECKVCGKRGFKNTVSWRNHEKLHESRKEYQCPTCGGVFYQQHHWRRHVKGCDGTGRRKSHSNLIVAEAKEPVQSKMEHLENEELKLSSSQ